MNREELKEETRVFPMEQAAYLAKWFRILFFWSLFAVIGRGALICERLLARIYKTYHLYLDFSIIGVTVLATIALAWVFWKLGKESTHYLCVMFFLMISFCVEILLFETGAAGPLWWGLRLLETGTVFAGTYQQYQGHAEILKGANNALAKKWRRLWKWCVRLLLGILAGGLTAWIHPNLGGILLLVSFIGFAALGILELVYLWRTVSAFWNYA